MDPTAETLQDFFTDKRVLITGHTGFKGAWLSLWLSHLGAKVTGAALAPLYTNGLYQFLPAGTFERDLRLDIRVSEGWADIIIQSKPDIVFHLAAQPLVRDSYDKPLETFVTNAVGTANLLDAIRASNCKANVFVVTSDKCYENKEWPHSYRENDPLGGHDVYSMSKAATELVAAGWRSSFFRGKELGKVITLRAGNVIGGGDFSKDRLIPDCVRSAAGGNPVIIRSPKATRPWQHVLDCLHGYLLTAMHAGQFPENDPFYDSFNFGPESCGARPVLEVVRTFFVGWPDSPRIEIETANALYHEAGYLSVAIDKATRLLGWKPVWGFKRALGETAAWYRTFLHDQDANLADVARQQIVSFEADATSL